MTTLPQAPDLKSRLSAVLAVAFDPCAADLLHQVADERSGRIVQTDADRFIAVYRSLTVALQVAATMLRRVKPDNPIRIGLSAGPVRQSLGRCAGAAVRKAITLQSRCSPARPLLLARGARAMLLDPDLASLDDGPDGHSWTGPSAADKAMASAPAFLGGYRQPMVGRDVELAAIETLLGRVSAGSAAWVLVTGEAGIGKSRLLGEAAQAARARGFQIVAGTAHEGENNPYAALNHALASWLDAQPNLAMDVPPGLSELARLRPEIHRMVPGLASFDTQDPSADQRRLFGAVACWISHLAARRPLLLVLDSFENEGNAGDLLIQSLVAALGDVPVLLAVASRGSRLGIDQAAARARDLWGEDRCRHLSLGRLSQSEVSLLLEHNQAFADLARAVHVVSEGRPLHVLQLLEGNPAAAELPQTVEQALSRRIEALPAPARQVLEVAAVLGAEFSARSVVEILEGDADCFEALDLATRRSMLRLVNEDRLRYQFAHALIRAAVLAQIGAARRAHLSAVTARVLARHNDRDGASVADVARLFSSAIPLGYRPQAIEWTERAADAALRQFANEDAASLYRQALKLSEENESDTVCRLSIGLGQARSRLGDSRSRQILLDAADQAERLGNGQLMAQAMLATYRLTFSRARFVDDESVRRLRRALSLLSSDHPELRARVTALLALELAWAEDRSESMALADEALALAESLDEANLAEVLARRQWVTFFPIEQRVAEVERLSALANRLSDPVLKFEAASHAIHLAIRRCDRQDLDTALSTMRTEARSSHLPHVKAMALLREATVALLEARYEDCLSLATERMNLTQDTGQIDGPPALAIHTFWAQYDTAAAADFEPVAGRFIDQLDRTPDYARPLTGRLALEFGHMDTVHKVTAEFRARALPMDQVYLWNLALLVPCAIAVDDRDFQGRLMSLLSPHREESASMVFCTLGPVTRYLGLLQAAAGNLQQAIMDLRDAVRSSTELGAPSWTARAQCDLAEVLRRIQPGAAEAEGLLKTVVSRAADSGWPRIEQQARTLLRSQSG